MTRTNDELRDVLNIRLTTYEAGGWGASNPRFQIQRTIVQRYGDTDDGKIRAFEDLAYKAFTIAENILPVLRRFPKLEWLKETDKIFVRGFVFKIINFWSDNRMSYEAINTATMSTTGFNLTTNNNATMLIGERIGMDAWAYVQASELWNTYIFESEEDYIAFVKTTTGNYEIIGKFDTDLYPVLT